MTSNSKFLTSTVTRIDWYFKTHFDVNTPHHSHLHILNKPSTNCCNSHHGESSLAHKALISITYIGWHSTTAFMYTYVMNEGRKKRGEYDD
jgi:hypothetical protein